MSALHDLTGQQYGSLTVISRAPSVPKSGGGTYAHWNCQCTCGATSVVRASHLTFGYVKSCGDRAQHPQTKRGADIGYNDTHRKIRAALGSARAYGCSRYDCTEWASQWAYDGFDPHELSTPGGGAYSANPDHYVPYCSKHHGEYDARRRQLARA